MKKSLAKDIRRQIDIFATSESKKPTKTMYRRAKKFYLKADGKGRAKIRG